MTKAKTRNPGLTAHAQPSAPLHSEARQPREGSKQALVVQLLGRPEGATVPNLIDATGWLPHTVRAALTGLRKRGFAIERATREGGQSAHRIATREPDPEPEPKTKRRSGRRPLAEKVDADLVA